MVRLCNQIMSKIKVLITGASGFTGKHLSNFLSQNDTRDLFFADRALSSGDTRYLQCDFIDASKTSELISRIKPDEIYNLIGSFTNDYDTDYASNVAATKNILDAVRGNSIKSKILLIGSCAEYGMVPPKNLPVKEDYPLHPVSVYGLVKVYQTKLMELYISLYGMDIRMARPFNLFGEGSSLLLLTGKIEQEIGKYKRGEIQNIDVATSSLSIERDYIDVKDAVMYYCKIMERGKIGEIYNVGSGKPTAAAKIISQTLQASGLSTEVIHKIEHNVPGKIVIPKIYADVTKINNL